MQNFCGNCGSRLREGARFCAVCGEPAGRYASRCELSFSRPAAPPHAPVSCMPAYIPGLFWLPWR